MARTTTPKTRKTTTTTRKRTTTSKTNGNGQATDILLDLEEINPKPNGERNRQAAKILDNEVLLSVAGLNMDAVSSNIASTQTEVQKSLTDLSSKLVERLQLLENVEKAIGLKQEDLRRLYEIEAAERDLDELKAEIDKQREDWELEQARKIREFDEQRVEREKQWAREEEEYNYQLAQSHRKKEDEFAVTMEERAKANQSQQEELDKSWATREEDLSKREKELVGLREKVEAFPELTRKEVNAAVAIATNSVKKEYETKATLAAKDLETFQKLAEQESASMRDSLDKAHTQINELKAQLDLARTDIKEISAKALDSASGRDALTQVQRVLEKEQSSKTSK